MPLASPLQLNMAFTVGIVGATGAVGKEIRTCLEAQNFPVETLRIFGSERSAGSVITTEKYGDVTVELFDVASAKQCDVVFLAVSGEFSLQHARALSDGTDGCVVIDNSVRCCFFLYQEWHQNFYIFDPFPMLIIR
jgi:aspartate-semialdehyde dehydrogenase